MQRHHQFDPATESFDTFTVPANQATSGRSSVARSTPQKAMRHTPNYPGMPSARWTDPNPSASTRPFERAIVKATLMRITLHAVAADDYTQLREAMLRVCGRPPRSSRRPSAFEEESHRRIKAVLLWLAH